MITEMGGQDYSIEFFVSFPTIYRNIMCDDGKFPAKIVLLYGGMSSYVLTHSTACVLAVDSNFIPLHLIDGP